MLGSDRFKQKYHPINQALITKVSLKFLTLHRRHGQDWNNILKKYGGTSSNGFHMILISGIHGNSKHQNPGSHFGATSYTALPIQLISLKIGPNWPNQQCCLAGSSKTAPRILTVSIAMGANNSFYVKSIATYAPTFLGYIISVLAIV